MTISWPSIRLQRLSQVVSLCAVLSACPGFGQQPASIDPQTSAQATNVPGPQSNTQRRAQRRSRRLAAQQAATQPKSQQSRATPAISDAQRLRDRKILDQQKAQSAEIARQNAAVNQKVIRDRENVQSEPRIQDAPGPGAQPLPGDPTAQPTQPADPPRIQDAPGPAQTLPKPPPPPPPAPAPPAAPQP